LVEELWEEDTPLADTSHPDVFRLDQDNAALPQLDLTKAIEQLSTLSLSSQPEAIAQFLDDLIPGATIRAAVRDELDG